MELFAQLDAKTTKKHRGGQEDNITGMIPLDKVRAKENGWTYPLVFAFFNHIIG